MIIIVNYCSLSILHLVLCLLRHKGKHLFSPILKPLLITQCYGTTISYMQLQQINQWRQRSCTAYGWKAHQNGRGIWLYNAGIRQGSSDFFSFSDNYKPSPLNEPLQRIQTSLCSADSPLLSSSWSTDSLPLSDNSLLRELLYKRANFCGVVGNAARFLSFVTPLHAADSPAARARPDATHQSNRDPGRR